MNQATYSPEDNKLRLYVGRVPRDEYEKLRADGWTSTPKQSCDFVATWTPTRRDTALEYADIIEDEDQGPEDRAADRAERFGEYRDKRTGEAVGQADRYEAGPQAHGYQSQARAERAANRHDRVASRACDAWSKAEYWQRRTAGVISNALYKSRPDVRMGRIKVLESDLRRFEASPEHYPNWLEHTRLRLAYENQMLEAQGGRAAFVEMIVGGFIGGRQIHKVNKSSATGRVVSVNVMGTHTGFTRESGYKKQETRPCLVTIETERLPADAYRAPSEEELKAFQDAKKATKAAQPTKEPCPLINPTDEDAEKLQKLLNDRRQAEHEARNTYTSTTAREIHSKQFKPSTVCRITQAHYSAVSKGSYGNAETRGLCHDAQIEPRESNMWNREAEKEAKERGPAVCQLRTAYSDGSDYGARRVIILTDKPQKPFPASVWEKFTPSVIQEEVTV